MPASLPAHRVLNSAFRERGVDHVVMIDVFPITDNEVIQVVFEDAQSPWRQGLWMGSDKPLVVNQKNCPSLVLWQDTSPRVAQVAVGGYLCGGAAGGLTGAETQAG